MPQPNNAAAIRNDVFLLLDQDVRHAGWEHTIGLKNAFYVRGFTWFRDFVLNGRLVATDCTDFIGMMKEEFEHRPAWQVANFKWNERFGSRQFIDTASPKSRYAPNFQKAVEVVLLCEIIARELKKKDKNCPSPDDVLNHMRIEPAVSFIHGFHSGVWESLTTADRVMLRQWTGQPGNEVFVEMTKDNNTVTHKLAERTKHFFDRKRPDIDLGDVSFHYRRGNTAKSEHIDVKEENLALEARRAAK